MLIHKKIAFSIASFACAIVMWQAMKNTCPPKEQHLQAVTDVVEKTVDRVFEERVTFPPESKRFAEYLSTQVIPQAVEKLTREKLNFSNYGIFSLGSIAVPDGDNTPLSIGVFGKVFTISEEDAYKYIDEYLNEIDIENILRQLNTNYNGNNDIENNER